MGSMGLFLSATTALLLAASGVAGQDDGGVQQLPMGERGDELPQYLTKICYPALAQPAPCEEIQLIEQACKPNGTEELNLEAHAQCICGGSFFAEWVGCLNCLFVHGFRSDEAQRQYLSVIAVVSTELCSPTDGPAPTAPFQDLFGSVQAALLGPSPTTTGHVSDLYPSNAAVSLYYTAAPGALRGPGSITGSAASATNTLTPTPSTSSLLWHSSLSPPYPTASVASGTPPTPAAVLAGSGTGVYTTPGTTTSTSSQILPTNSAPVQEPVGVVAVAIAVAFAAMM